MVRLLSLTAVVSALTVAGLAAPAAAMHESPSPVGDVAPSFSGHYSKPDVGSYGTARPWEAGPARNR